MGSRLGEGDRIVDDVARLRKIFDEGPLGVAVLDATYRLVDVNSRFCDMLGYTPGRTYGADVPGVHTS